MLAERSEAFADDTFAALVAQGMAAAEAASRREPNYCHWVKTNNRFFRGRWVTCQWVGFIDGQRVAVVTYDGREETRRHRFMAYAMSQYVGHYRTWQEAQEMAAEKAAAAIDDAVVVATTPAVELRAAP